MGLKPFHNDTGKMVHLGGKMIRPGETREVDETLLPTFKAKPADAPVVNPSTALLAILDLSIPKITDRLADLSDEELDTIEAAEKAGKTRTGLLNAIAEERLERAANSPNALDVADLKIALAEMDEDELLEQLNVFAGDEGRLALVQEEIDLRAATNGAGDQ